MSGEFDPFGEDADLDFGQNDEVVDQYALTIEAFDQQLARLKPGTPEYEDVFNQKSTAEGLQALSPIPPRRIWGRRQK